jgi:hypothetical protein
MRTAMAVLTGPSCARVHAAHEMLCSAGGVHDAHPKAEVMTALGNNVHIFARPHRRQDLIWCFDSVLGCGPVDTVQHSGMTEPILLVRFPGGGHLSSDRPVWSDPTARRGHALTLVVRE